MTTAAWLWAGVITAAGAALQGSVGFGYGVFAVPFLLLIEPAFVPGPMLAAASCSRWR